MHAHSARFTQSEDALQKLAESIAAYWEPLRTWTPVALLLSKNANILAASSTAALALVIPVEALKKRNKKVEKKLAYSKIADEDKRILTALGNLQRKNLSTLYDLKQSCQTLNNLDISARRSCHLGGDYNESSRGNFGGSVRGSWSIRYPPNIWK